MIGKDIRLERVINRNSGRTIIVPLDHGITLGPIPGLTDTRRAITGVVQGGANAIILHKGLIRAGHRRRGRDVGLIVHLSASTSISPDPNAKVLVCTVEEAVRLGADAVSIHVNLGAATDREMLRTLGETAKHCRDWGMPLLAMMYTRGRAVANEFDHRLVKHAARVGAELGADIVKVNYTGSAESFSEVIAGCPVPIVIAGGEKMETDRELLIMVEGALQAGACGVSIGRNIFQHQDPGLIIKAINLLTHKRKSSAEAIEFVETRVQREAASGSPGKKS